ncbi:putative O-glycosylation ligase, exosortase A system-associated [Accumulibacter sp.]|uniref:putative O-glycosylation ligase, exosortase A system-associated n=1 Tax=Accumulibacter sp. TaxID=2053492 RepID=UPI0025FCE736|nr:putative O-glycosylation ligase, exosortase A system-associated [Accumulibacter sp.]MCM8613031.1 putative O-glycosylation ligase, exosortase A system-associated [Accumulibacter sp.]MCM8636769.1 putative O-glycosylation ligase, exosortase A system-associated [Accumulibacter sp.]MCM8640420.1 putative O-glycosylation ligase, exosortase A system-associated [Accumulibacter sp.]
MRDLLLVGIFLAVLPFALRNTWIGVLLWTWLSLMNPHRLTYGFAYDAPFAATAAGVIFLSLFIGRDKLRMPWSPPVIVLFLFVFWMCVTTAFALSPADSWNQLSKVLKIQVVTAIALMALQERRHIELFIWVNALSIGFYGFKGGLYTVLSGGGGRVWGPTGTFIADNNHLAVAVIMVIPLLNYLRTVATGKYLRLGLLALMVLCAFSALGSQSRGALLAIAAMTLVLWARAPNKAVTGVILAVTGVALIAFMPAAWDERMATIATYESDGSAMGRISTWKFCANLAADRLTGGGFSIYNFQNLAIWGPPGARSVHVAHSIYFSVLGEHGYVGLLLFLLLWWLAMRQAARLRKASQGKPELAWVFHLVGMCQVSLVGYLVGGAFLQLAYFDLPYNILVVLVVTQRWLDAGAWKEKAGGTMPAAEAAQQRPLSSAATQQVTSS